MPKRTRRASASAVPESNVQSACLQWLNSVPGVKMWRQNRGARLNIYKRKDGTEGRSYVRFGEPGATDTTGVGPLGIRIEIEIKRVGERPDLEQLNYMAMVQDAGGISFWCDSLRSCVEQLRAEFLRREWSWSRTWECW
jgi:hypothetical protein